MTKASDDLQDLRRRIYVKARLNRRGGGWKRGMVEIVGHSQTKGRDNREPKLRPKPARQSSTLPEGGEARSLPYPYPRGGCGACVRDKYLLIQFSNSACLQTQPRDLAARCARALRRLPPSIRTRGRRESRVRAAPAVSCANMHRKTHTSIQVQRRHPGLPCAMVYGLLRALPGDRAFLPPSSTRSFASRELDTSVGVSGPHGFTVRSSHARQSQLSRPPHPTARS